MRQRKESTEILRPAEPGQDVRSMTFKKEGSRQSRQRKLCNLEQVRRGCRLGAAKCWLQDTACEIHLSNGTTSAGQSDPLGRCLTADGDVPRSQGIPTDPGGQADVAEILQLLVDPGAIKYQVLAVRQTWRIGQKLSSITSIRA